MDYQFRLVERGGGNISLLEYKGWRTNGTAFVIEDDPEKTPQPNMTLVSSMKSINRKDGGANPSSISFFGDIVTGPFLCYGLNPSYEAVSVDKTKISRPSQELATKRIQEIVDNIEEKISNKNNNSVSIEVVFLPLTAERDIKRSSKEFEDKFDVSFIACSVAHIFSTEFTKNIVNGGSIIVETPLFLLHMAKEIQEKFKEHLINIISSSTDSLKIEDENYDNLKTSTVVIKKA